MTTKNSLRLVVIERRCLDSATDSKDLEWN